MPSESSRYFSEPSQQKSTSKEINDRKTDTDQCEVKKDITILSAHKGNVITVLDPPDYESKIRDRLDPESYK